MDQLSQPLYTTTSCYRHFSLTSKASEMAERAPRETHSSACAPFSPPSAAHSTLDDGPTNKLRTERAHCPQHQRDHPTSVSPPGRSDLKAETAGRGRGARADDARRYWEGFRPHACGLWRFHILRPLRPLDRRGMNAVQHSNDVPFRSRCLVLGDHQIINTTPPTHGGLYKVIPRYTLITSTLKYGIAREHATFRGKLT